MNRILVTFAIILTMVGCAPVTRNTDQDRVHNINQIKEGVTTKQEVYDLLGRPERATNLAAGDSYWSYDMKTSGTGNAQDQYLVIIFGRNGIVKKILGKADNAESDLGVKMK